MSASGDSEVQRVISAFNRDRLVKVVRAEIEMAGDAIAGGEYQRLRDPLAHACVTFLDQVLSEDELTYTVQLLASDWALLHNRAVTGIDEMLQDERASLERLRAECSPAELAESLEGSEGYVDGLLEERAAWMEVV